MAFHARSEEQGAVRCRSGPGTEDKAGVALERFADGRRRARGSDEPTGRVQRDARRRRADRERNIRPAPDRDGMHGGLTRCESRWRTIIEFREPERHSLEFRAPLCQRPAVGATRGTDDAGDHEIPDHDCEQQRRPSRNDQVGTISPGPQQRDHRGDDGNRGHRGRTRNADTEGGLIHDAVQSGDDFGRIEYRAPADDERQHGEQDAPVRARIIAGAHAPAPDAQRADDRVEERDNADRACGQYQGAMLQRGQPWQHADVVAGITRQRRQREQRRIRDDKIRRRRREHGVAPPIARPQREHDAEC